MQVEAVQISTALDWAIRLIGGLVALNLGTLVYIFKSLKSEVKDVGQKVSQLQAGAQGRLPPCAGSRP